MKKFAPLLLLVILFHKSDLIAQESFTLMLDRNFSSSVGAENLLSVHRLSYVAESSFLKPTWFDESSIWGKTGGISYRLGKTVLLDNIIDQFTDLVQHEVYGHGYRAREYEASDIRYTLHLFPPFGSGEGETTFHYPPDNPVSPDQDLSMTTAGVEASSILSRRLLFRWLERGKINYRETLLYAFSSNDLTEYLWLTKLSNHHSEGNDMLSYEKQVNEREGIGDPAEYKLTVNKMAAQSFVVLLDPFQYYSIYSLFKSYIYSGEESFEFPMLQLGRFRYLPCFRLGLTTFGTEITFDNFLVRSHKVLDLYFRYGIPTFHRFWGIGFYGMNIVEAGRFKFDLGMDLWNQPTIYAYGPDYMVSKAGLGGAMSCMVLAKLTEMPVSLSVVGEMKAKTAGYLAGEPLRDALLLRAGVSLTVR